MIMILTGKCLQAFNNFLECHKELNENIIDNMDNYPTYKNALVIEFFDTSELLKGFKSFENIFYKEYRRTVFQDRKKATEKAIIHANKIHNETKE